MCSSCYYMYHEICCLSNFHDFCKKICSQVASRQSDKHFLFDAVVDKPYARVALGFNRKVTFFWAQHHSAQQRSEASTRILDQRSREKRIIRGHLAVMTEKKLAGLARRVMVTVTAAFSPLVWSQLKRNYLARCCVNSTEQLFTGVLVRMNQFACIWLHSTRQLNLTRPDFLEDLHGSMAGSPTNFGMQISCRLPGEPMQTSRRHLSRDRLDL